MTKHTYKLHCTLLKPDGNLTTPFELILYAKNSLKAFNLCVAYVRIKHGKMHT